MISKIQSAKKQNGFSLIELTIVLVVIGLVVVAVLAGQNLMAAAGVRNILNEVEMYQSAIKNFQETYEELPGDMTTATTYWSGVENGNGDEQIAAAESNPAWEHLESAELISAGDLSGDGTTMTPGTTVPASKFTGAAYSILYASALWDRSTATETEVENANYLFFGAAGTARTVGQMLPIMTPKEASEVDEKIDDGNPSMGRAIAGDSFTGGLFTTGGCITVGGAGPENDLYTRATDLPVCQLAFRLSAE